MSTAVRATVDKSVSDRLAGRKLWIPRMTYTGARMMAAVFRSVGIDAAATPESDERTLELAGLYLGGEECYPKKVTLGDFLRIIRADDFDPDKTAFFMPTAEGPCRFGQYAPYLKQVLAELGHESIPVVCPTSKNGYDGFADHAPDMMRRLWRGLVAADILQKLLLKTRPYETHRGMTDQVYSRSVERVAALLETPGLRTGPAGSGRRPVHRRCPRTPGPCRRGCPRRGGSSAAAFAAGPPPPAPPRGDGSSRGCDRPGRRSCSCCWPRPPARPCSPSGPAVAAGKARTARTGRVPRPWA